MHFLYPSDPFRKKRVDEFYAAELAAVRAAGFDASVFSLEDFQEGTFSAYPPLPPVAILYRGWMLSAAEYERLAAAIQASGAHPFTDTVAYLSTHYLPNWYPIIAEFTPETRIFPSTADLVSELHALDWSEYFIKDYVKSLKTSVGSRISTPEQAATVAAEMLRFRGTVEGGFCVRRVENFRADTEQRYFVFNSVARSASGLVPPIVTECAQRFRSRFFSIDIVERTDGLLRVVEVGDGQVSDLVGWTTEKFVEVFNASPEASVKA